MPVDHFISWFDPIMFCYTRYIELNNLIIIICLRKSEGSVKRMPVSNVTEK